MLLARTNPYRLPVFADVSTCSPRKNSTRGTPLSHRSVRPIRVRFRLPGGELLVYDEDEFPARPAALAEAVRLHGVGQAQAVGRLISPGAITTLAYRPEERGQVERMPNPEDRRSASLRETEVGLRDSLEHLRPYIQEMRGIEEGFTEGKRAVISRYLEAATEATHRHADRLARSDP
jgi:DNA-binding MarR family transcriptional regulator